MLLNLYLLVDGLGVYAMTGLRRILVPLDGFRLAEAVLPSALGLSTRMDARLVLLHVVERKPPRTVHGQAHLTAVPDAEAYLAKVAEDCRAAGPAVEVHLHPDPMEDVAQSIAAHAGSWAPS